MNDNIAVNHIDIRHVAARDYWIPEEIAQIRSDAVRRIFIALGAAHKFAAKRSFQAALAAWAHATTRVCSYRSRFSKQTISRAFRILRDMGYLLIFNSPGAYPKIRLTRKAIDVFVHWRLEKPELKVDDPSGFGGERSSLSPSPRGFEEDLLNKKNARVIDLDARRKSSDDKIIPVRNVRHGVVERPSTREATSNRPTPRKGEQRGERKSWPSRDAVLASIPLLMTAASHVFEREPHAKRSTQAFLDSPSEWSPEDWRVVSGIVNTVEMHPGAPWMARWLVQTALRKHLSTAPAKAPDEPPVSPRRENSEPAAPSSKLSSISGRSEKTRQKDPLEETRRNDPELAGIFERLMSHSRKKYGT